MQPGYDHSYYFIATFLADHFAHHCAALAGGHNQAGKSAP
jgi:S-formylglutathione hydrolase